MNEENKEKQKEELEALHAIYSDDMKWVGKNNFSISVVDGHINFTFNLLLNDHYPSHKPPTYSFDTRSLTTKQHSQLQNILSNIYRENQGECIIFQWISATNDFLNDIIKEDGDIGKEEGNDNDIDNTLINEERFSQDTKSGPIIDIHHGEILTDRKSTFQGHVAEVHCKAEVDQMLQILKENKKISIATHNMVAYRIEENNGKINSGCMDDGETGASARMLNIMHLSDARNVCVVVSRWYGGIHLGPDRFKHINSITTQILQHEGFIKQKQTKNKKGTKCKK